MFLADRTPFVSDSGGPCFMMAALMVEAPLLHFIVALDACLHYPCP
jgi:hypothetical protein